MRITTLHRFLRVISNITSVFAVIIVFCSLAQTHISKVIAATNLPLTVYSNGPYYVNEGSFVQLSATGQDPENGSLVYAWDLDNNGSFETSGQNVSYNAADLDGPSNYLVTVQVTDDEGLTASDQAVINVQNVPPIINYITGNTAPMPIGYNTYIVAGIFEAVKLDTLSAVWDWGDNTVSSGTIFNDSANVYGIHAYTSAGVYTVTLTLMDDDLGTAVKEFTYLVVFDSGTSLMGSGTINMPPGSIVSDPGESGKAKLGVVAKYNNEQVLISRLRLNFKNGQYKFNFEFESSMNKSDSSVWLVATNGNQAQLHGLGTVNGVGAYTFLLTVIDDSIRMQVWNYSYGSNLVFDSGTVPLQAGNIRINN